MLDPLNTLQNSLINLRKSKNHETHAHNAQIFRTDANQLILIRKNLHQKLRHEQSTRRKNKPNRRRNLRTDTKNRLNRISVLFAPILSRKHHDAGRKTDKKQEQNELNVRSKVHRRNRILTNITEHHDISRPDRRRNQVLERNRPDNSKKRLKKLARLRPLL